MVFRKTRLCIRENGNNGHNKAKNDNIVRQWKEENDVEYFFNFFLSPNLFFIENCSQSSKQHLKKFPY